MLILKQVWGLYRETDLRNMIIAGQMPPSMLSSCFAVCEDLHASWAREVSKSWMLVCVCYPSQATNMPWMWGLLGWKMDTCCCKWWTPGYSSCGFYHRTKLECSFQSLGFNKILCFLSHAWQIKEKPWTTHNHPVTEKLVQYRPGVFSTGWAKKTPLQSVSMLLWLSTSVHFRQLSVTMWSTMGASVIHSR